jgi:hypothetical protein
MLRLCNKRKGATMADHDQADIERRRSRIEGDVAVLRRQVVETVDELARRGYIGPQTGRE